LIVQTKTRCSHPSSVESIRDQCTDQGVAFFFKQWGGFQKRKAGRELRGRTYDAMPRVTAARPPVEVERLRRQREAELLARTFQRRAGQRVLRVVPA